MAGYFAWRCYRRTRATSTGNDIDLILLIILLFCIAIGSTLWHTLAQPWAELADSIPILLFISVYMVSFLARLLQYRYLTIFFIFTLFQLVNNSVIFLVPRDLLNGSLFYVPTWLSLCVFTVILLQRQYPGRGSFVIATLLFSAAIVFRSIDILACSAFPVGTHFIWHLLVALVLYKVLIPVIQQSVMSKQAPTQEP